MGYAIRKDGQGWRAIDGLDDVGTDEDYLEIQPAPIVPNPADEKAAMLKIGRSMRETVLNRLVGILQDAMISGDSATIMAISNTKQQLKDITVWPAVVAAVTGDETKVAFLTRYYQISHELQVASPYAYTAFTGLDM